MDPSKCEAFVLVFAVVIAKRLFVKVYLAARCDAPSECCPLG